QHLWFTERVIDIVAGELELDPVEVRKRNYIKSEEMPYETPNGCIYDSGDYAKMLDVALDLIGYDELESRRSDAERRGKLLGLGAGRGATEMLAERMRTLAPVVLGCAPDDIERAEGQARIKSNPEAALPFMALGAIINANNAGLPEDLDVTLNCRYVYRPPFE